jgi:predicted N-acetyltransferase YhbS
MFEVRREEARDSDEVEFLFDLAFAPGREALSSYRLRAGVEPVSELCHVARDPFSLAGAIRYWPVRIGQAGDPALLLGPVAVHPTRQGEGIGAVLIGDSLALARDLGWRRVILVGDEPYYGRFGFERRLAEGLSFPPPTNPNRLLARELAPDAMVGVNGQVQPWRGPPNTTEAL